MKFEITCAHKDTLYFTLVTDEYRLTFNRHFARYNLLVFLTKDVADKFKDMGVKIRKKANAATGENVYFLGPLRTDYSNTITVYSVDGSEPKPFESSLGLPEVLRDQTGMITIDGVVHYHKASGMVNVYAKKLTFEF